MCTSQPREVEAVPSANVQFLSSSGITHGSNSTLVIFMIGLVSPFVALVGWAKALLRCFDRARHGTPLPTLDCYIEGSSSEQLLNDLIRALKVLLELLRADVILSVARLFR